MVDEHALIPILDADEIANAGLDVFNDKLIAAG
jgi:lactate dehydrogenase-like 2-hydroxyacid dehydrogenase